MISIKVLEIMAMFVTAYVMVDIPGERPVKRRELS